MSIEKKQIAHNKSARTATIKYIVIHDTQNANKGADAEAHFKYFNGGNRNSSADFFVDNKKILQINDYTKYATWQVGDGKGKYGITNQNSIGVEICINSDGDYEKAVANAIKLTKHLMKELDIPAERVVRHYDASRKNCPASMSGNNWAVWSDFKEKIKGDDLVFTDTKGHYAEKEIRELCEMGIVNGKSHQEFNPDSSATRAEIAVMIRRAIRFITGK